MCLNPEFFTQSLSPKLVKKYYPKGFFPWTSRPFAWYNPAQRMVLDPTKVYEQKSLKRFINAYELRADYDFPALIRLCSSRENTWIDEDFIEVFEALFNSSHAHSLEVYQAGELIGGIYGLIIGQVFFGESMISLRKNASKVALVSLCKLLAPFDFLIDCQVYNPHLAFMGAQNMPKSLFLELLAKKTEQKSGFDDFKSLLK